MFHKALLIPLSLPSDFQTTMDSEVIVKLIARSHAGNGGGKNLRYHEPYTGAYALVICTGHSVIGVRDPFGYRPLVIGRTSRGGWVLASETCALDAVGAQRVRDVQPGEIVTVDAEGIHSIFCREAGGTAGPCVCLNIFISHGRTPL